MSGLKKRVFSKGIIVPYKSRPRTGSLQFRPRKRAQKETPSFSSYPKTGGKTRPLGFFGYKAGMIHVLIKDEQPKTTSFGQEISRPATVIECPPLKILGVRAYEKNESDSGMHAFMEVSIEKPDSHVLRRVHSFKKKQSKKEKKQSNTIPASLDDLFKQKDRVVELRLLVHTQPFLTNFGKKKPEVCEVGLNGTMDEQLQFVKDHWNKSIAITDVFEKGQLLDVKAVSKGKGFEGVIRRHHVKMQRHKAKKVRTVGAISPWHPPTVMWTVARPGQMGYHVRTEFNKQVLEIGKSGEAIAPANGFAHYGVVQNDFLVIAGSIPGPAKRCIGLRNAIRAVSGPHKYGLISFFSSKKAAFVQDNQPKIQKVKLQAEKKTEHKSVEQELAEAAKQAK